MFNAIRENIKNFLDATVFIAMIAIGLFAIMVDGKYFRNIKFKKDAAVSMAIGIIFLLLPFALLLISKI